MSESTAAIEARRAREARIEREDVAMFLAACFACTGQAEYYADRGQQAVSIAFLHEYVRVNYRRLYARSLAAGINDFSRGMVVQGLLAAGAPLAAADRAEEGALIEATLADLPPPRVYRLFRRLQIARVNNRRTRTSIKRYLSRRDLAFDALKYRPGLRSAARHGHGALPGEIGPFLFERPAVPSKWETPLLETWRVAHFSKRALFELPMTVAEGLLSKHRLSRKRFLEGIQAQMTESERLRVEASARREGAKLARADLSRMGLTRLVLYTLARPPEERAGCAEAIATAAGRVAALLPRLGAVSAVLDRSRSAAGSKEKVRRPLAVTLAVHAVLRAVAERDGTPYRARWTVPPSEGDGAVPLQITPRGQTDLASPLIGALADEPDLVLIISDGYENTGSGSADEVVRVARARLGSSAPVLHLSPVFDPERYAPRSLGPHITTVGIRTAADVPVALRLARFVDGSGDLATLEGWLGARAEAFIARHRRRMERRR